MWHMDSYKGMYGHAGNERTISFIESNIGVANVTVYQKCFLFLWAIVKFIFQPLL